MIALDECWRSDMWLTCRFAVAFLATLYALDAGAGTLSTARAAVWTVLGALLFLSLVRPLVTAGHGWLASRWLWHERVARTDRLASVRWSEGGARVSLRHGKLWRGAGVLRQFSERIDEQTASAIFKVSGMSEGERT